MISCLKIDERAVHEFKIPVLTLMERAGNAVADAVLTNFKEVVRLDIPYEEDPGFVAVKKKIEESNLVIDAIVGTGLKREITGLMSQTIQALNASGKVVVAVDIPSGLDADTAEIHGICVRADVTVTMGASPKGCIGAGRERIHSSRTGRRDRRVEEERVPS